MELAHYGWKSGRPLSELSHLTTTPPPWTWGDSGGEDSGKPNSGTSPPACGFPRPFPALWCTPCSTSHPLGSLQPFGPPPRQLSPITVTFRRSPELRRSGRVAQSHKQSFFSEWKIVLVKLLVSFTKASLSFASLTQKNTSLVGLCRVAEQWSGLSSS